MNEKPILFNGEMVRAILEGRKTITRRVILKKRKIPGEPRYYTPDFPLNQFLEVADCPYSVPGDCLWVRESFYVQPELAPLCEPQPIHYRADTLPEQVEDYVCKPSIHMPRWASRITLEVTGVRVERVQDISEEDARAEGIQPEKRIDLSLPPEQRETMLGCKYLFRYLWDDLNLKRGYGWDMNPWVWVVGFQQIDTDE